MERYRFAPIEQMAMERAPIPFAVFQLVDNRIVAIALSNGFCELLGTADHAQAYADMDLDTYRNVHADDVSRLANTVLHFMQEGGQFETVYRLKRPEGGYRLIHAFGRHVYMDEGVRLAYVWMADEGLYTDTADGGDVTSPGKLTELSQSLSNAIREGSILKASYYDALTGLPSMSYFFELVADGRKRMLAKGGRPAFMYTDFMGMKYYNARHGFAEGDKLLQDFARALIGLFGDEWCCHISGDHFAVCAESEGLSEKLDKLLDLCRKLNGGKTMPVHVGVYLSEDDHMHAGMALDRAKLACTAIAGRYGTAVHYYSRELSDGVERRQYIIENFEKAMGERWIQVYYQPIVRAVNARVCDEEALARWIDPVKGMLSPGEFIPALEDAGLIYKLDLYMLDRVLEKIHLQEEKGMHIVPHSINLSRSDFEACDIVEEIRARVDAAGVPRDRITIEITESVIGKNFDFMKQQVERFQALGFPVWMDDFGSGYSSLDVLQSIKFNLLKFDMSFMRRLDKDKSSRIVLTELMRMATALGLDTVCEGVETVDQVRFLQEIGCSKLQGFFYCRPIPMEEIFERFVKGMKTGYENPEESEYYESVSRVNLYDLGAIASGESQALQNAFNNVPMSIVEVQGDRLRFMRSNQSYRDFIRRFFRSDPVERGTEFSKFTTAFLRNVVRTCREPDTRSFFDEKMSDGSVVHSLARRIGINPVNDSVALAVAVLSVTEPDEGASYADIARALAADYYNIYVVDLDTEHFIEYTSPAGAEELAMERHGENFFAAVQRESRNRIYEEDRETFLASFSKAQIIHALDTQGVYTNSYRLIDTGEPLYAGMKVTRMQPGGSRIIMGISIIDTQMKQQAAKDRVRKERDTLAGVMALSEDYLVLYSVNPVTDSYVEYSASDDYESLGLAKEGSNFFAQAIADGKNTVHPDDLALFLNAFTKENILKAIGESRVFKLQYRLVINGQTRSVSLKIAPYNEHDETRLVVGLRAWRARGGGQAEG